MKKVRVVLTILMVAMLASCATILSGSQDAVSFDSEPRGAQIIVDGTVLGVTPLTVNLKRNKYKQVEVRLDGYKVQTRPLSTSYDPVALINIVWDWSTTDVLTGNAFEYEPSSYYFRLDKN